MKIQILVLEGCPNASLARAAVDRALAHAGQRATIEQIMVTGEGHAGFAGSPTILVNGRDVQPSPAGSCGLACRIYPNPENPGIPDAESLLRAIESCEKAGLP